MKIETKYNIGDEVFYFKDDKISGLWKGYIRHMYVARGQLTQGASESTSAFYTIDWDASFPENKIFKDKEEALAYCKDVCAYHVGEEIK